MVRWGDVSSQNPLCWSESAFVKGKRRAHRFAITHLYHKSHVQQLDRLVFIYQRSHRMGQDYI